MAARSEAPNTLLTFESSQRVCMHASKRFVKQALAVSHTTNMQAIQ